MYLISLGLLVGAHVVFCEIGCSGVWHPFGDSCYLSSVNNGGNLITWADARDLCSSVGSNLVSINSIEENTFVLHLLNGTHPAVWMGLRNNDPILGHFWVDNSPYQENMTYWLPGQPDNGDAIKMESCTEMYTNTSGYYVNVTLGLWNSANCQAVNNYVCKKPKHFKPPGKEFGCRYDWIEFNKKCFKVFSEKLNFDAAKQFCSEYRNISDSDLTTRSTLLTLRNEDDQNFILTLTWGMGPLWLGIEAEASSNYNSIWEDDLMTLNSYSNFLIPTDYYPPIYLFTSPKNFGNWNSDPNMGTEGEVSEMSFACTEYKHYRKPEANPIVPQSFNDIECPENFVAFGIYCYHFADNEKSFSDANNYCEELSTANFSVGLATVLNPLDDNFIQFQFKNFHDQFWNGSLVWSDDWPFQYDQNKIINAKIGNFCATISLVKSELAFTQSNCSHLFRPLCKGQLIATKLTMKYASNCLFEPNCFNLDVSTDLTGDNYLSSMRYACSHQDRIVAEFNSYAEMANFINVKDSWKFDQTLQSCEDYKGSTYQPHNPWFYIGLMKLKNETFLHWASDNANEVEFYRWGIGEPKYNMNELNKYDIYILIDHYGYWHSVTSKDTSIGGDSKCYPILCMSSDLPTTVLTSTTTLPSTTGPHKSSTIAIVVGTVFGVVISISLSIVLYKFRFDILNKLRSRYRLHVPENLN